MSLASKLETVVWFIRQPQLYPQLGYLFRQRFFPHPLENGRAEATSWCHEHSISTFTAIKKITGIKNIETFETLFGDLIDEAKKQIKNIPVKMGGGADLELLFFLTEYVKARIVVETGVAYGWSSLAILTSLKKRKNTILYSTDMPYPKMNNEDFVGCVVPESLKGHWRLIRLPDRQSLRKVNLKHGSIDLCHYDSDKSYRGREWAYPVLWNLLKVGGIFISDDIQDNTAFRDFAIKRNENPIIVYHPGEDKYIGILLKSR